MPSLPFEVFEKLDGSLIIVFHHRRRWWATTKGEFNSDQARWAQAQLEHSDLSALTSGSTYLFEAVHPGNRIIVRYDQPALVLLAAYNQDGRELEYEHPHPADQRITIRYRDVL